MIELVRDDRGELVLRVVGAFDRQAAADLAARLCAVPAAARLVIDFSRVEDFPAAGVAAVARELAGRERLAVRGLDYHHLRLLRYCGVELPGARWEQAEQARKG